MAPGDKRRQREREKMTEVTQELCTGVDEHMSKGESEEHSAPRTLSLAGPCPCSLRRAPTSASARES